MVESNKNDRVYAQLRAEIVAGVIPPGASLSAIAIGERLQASRTPVRQAFVRLEGEGLVTLVDRQGARVAPISVRGVRDLHELRILLESEAAAMVASSVANDSDVGTSFAAISTELDVLRTRPPSEERRTRFYELAEEFDSSVVRLTRNAHLARAIAELRPHSERLRSITHSIPDRIEFSLVEHQRMCRAIIAGDADEARAAAKAHLAAAEQSILSAVFASAGNGRDVGIDLVST